MRSVPEDWTQNGDMIWIDSFVLHCSVCHWKSIPFIYNRIVT